MGAALMFAILALIMPLAAHGRCLGPTSRCGMLYESPSIGQVLPQVRTAQTRLLFQWVEEEEDQPLSVRGRRPQRPRCTPPVRRDTRSRRSRRDSRRPRRTRFPEDGAAVTAPVALQPCLERLRLGGGSSCGDDSSDRQPLPAAVHEEPDAMRGGGPDPVAAADADVRPDDVDAQEPDTDSTDGAAHASAEASDPEGRSAEGRGDIMPPDVEDSTSLSATDVPAPTTPPAPAQGAAASPTGFVVTVGASAPPKGGPPEVAEEAPVAVAPAAEGAVLARARDEAEVGPLEGMPPRAVAPVKDDQDEEDRGGGAEAGESGQEGDDLADEGDAAGSGPGVDPSVSAPAEGAAEEVPVELPSAVDVAAAPLLQDDEQDAMDPDNTRPVVAVSPAADGKVTADRDGIPPPTPPTRNIPPPEATEATPGAPSDALQAESGGEVPDVVATVPLQDESGKRVVCVTGKSQSFGNLDGRKPNGITVSAGGRCRLSEWAGGFDGYWSADAGDGHEDGLATAVKLMLRETGARVGAEVGRNNPRNAGVNAFMKEMRDRADPVNLDYPEDLEIADGGMRKANIRKASDACSRMITVREC